MGKDQHVILVFASVHYTLEAETYLQSAQWTFLVIPVPPKVNEGCGIGIKVAESDQQEVIAFLAQHSIKPIKTVKI